VTIPCCGDPRHSEHIRQDPLIITGKVFCDCTQFLDRTQFWTAHNDRTQFLDRGAYPLLVSSFPYTKALVSVITLLHALNRDVQQASRWTFLLRTDASPKSRNRYGIRHCT
jgi:hypothetical protein